MTSGDASQQLARIIENARKHSGLTQSSFAASIHKTQGQVSKYERGDVAPPPEVIIHCMNILGLMQRPAISADKLARTITERLRGEEHQATRTALAELIDQVAPPVSARHLDEVK